MPHTHTHTRCSPYLRREIPQHTHIHTRAAWENGNNAAPAILIPDFAGENSGAVNGKGRVLCSSIPDQSCLNRILRSPADVKYIFGNDSEDIRFLTERSDFTCTPISGAPSQNVLEGRGGVVFLEGGGAKFSFERVLYS